MKHTKRKSRSNGLGVLVGIMAFVIVALVAVIAFLFFRGNVLQPQTQPQTQPQIQAAETQAANPNGYPAEYQMQFATIWEKNHDFKAYLNLEGSPLATTVVQGTDNSKYQQQGFDGAAGSAAFLDYRADIKTPSSQLLVYLPSAETNSIYGELSKYKTLDFYKEHPVISFDTVYQNGKYKVFSVALLPADSTEIPYQNCMESSDKTQFVDLVQKAMEHSIMQIPVEVNDKDKLLTIVADDITLKDENGKPAKILVFARKLRAGESAAVDTASVEFKPNTYLPESWYAELTKTHNEATVNSQIRQEAAGWFTENELAQLRDEELETQLNARKAELVKYLSEQEYSLSADEKLYLYNQRKYEPFKLSTVDYTAKIDELVTLKLENKYIDPNAEYIWRVSDESVVKLVPGGTYAKITGLKAGQATITVSSGEYSASCIARIKANGLTLSPSSQTLTVGNYFNVTAGEDITKVSSSNVSVANVNYSGKNAVIYGVGVGEATVTFTGKSGATGTCKVKVENTGFSMDRTSLALEKGNFANLYITSGEAVNWYTNNPNVVRLNIVNNGQAVQLEAVGTGSTSIVATSRYGAQVSCSITVSDSSIAISSSYLNMNVGNLAELRVTRGSAYRWVSSDESIAVVYAVGDGSVAQVEARKSGAVTIAAQAANGTYATCSVSVSAPVAALSISPGSMTINAGEIRNISVTSGSAHSWVSSNPGVAQVYPVGDGTMAQVEGYAAGNTTISVYDINGACVTCNVTVQAVVPQLAIGPSSLYMTNGDTNTITVSSGTAVNWSSTNSGVAQVYPGSDPSWVYVQAVGAGSAQIYAYDAYGNVQACYVTVENPAYVEPVAAPLSVSPTSITVQEGDWGELYVTSGTALKWETNNSNVVALYDSGDGALRFKAVAPGYADILVYGENGAVQVAVSVVPWG